MDNKGQKSVDVAKHMRLRFDPFRLDLIELRASAMRWAKARERRKRRAARWSNYAKKVNFSKQKSTRIYILQTALATATFHILLIKAGENCNSRADKLKWPKNIVEGGQRLNTL